MVNSIWQSPVLDLVNINVFAIVHQNIPFGSGDRASFTPFSLSQFGPQQSNPVGQVLLIAMCMQNLSKIFLLVQELWVIFTVSQFGPRQSIDQWKMVHLEL